MTTKLTESNLNLLVLLIGTFYLTLLSSDGQTISGIVTPALGASVEVSQGLKMSAIPVNQQTGEWSLRLPGNGDFEVRAYNVMGHLCDPPRRGGSPQDTSGLAFTMVDHFYWSQIYGRVTANGSGVGGATITYDDATFSSTVGQTTTSAGGQGEMPRGMYNILYPRFSPIGSLAITPNKPGVSTFTPGFRRVDGDRSSRDINFAIPVSAPTPAPPAPTPPPPATTYTISGVVTASNGAPLDSVTIFGGPALGNTRTNSQGQYSFDAIPEGTVVGFGPVYAAHYFTPQNHNAPSGITANIVQNFVGQPLNGPPILSIQPQDITVDQHYQATFRAHYINGTAGGTTAQWFRNGVAMPGQTSTILEFPAQFDDHGSHYRCQLTNAYGSVWSNTATLTVRRVPEVTSTPVDQTIFDGDSVTFTVNAVGAGTLGYLWLTGQHSFPTVNANTITLTPKLDAQGNITFPSGIQRGDENGNTTILYALVKNQTGNTLAVSGELTVLPRPSASPATGGSIQIVAGGFDDWMSNEAAAHGADTQQSGDDNDDDGFTAIIEYALGLSPFQSDGRDAYHYERTDSGIALVYRAMHATTGVTVVPEWSDDLSSWQESAETSPSGRRVELKLEQIDSNNQYATNRLSSTNASSGRQQPLYLRLKVVQN